MKLPRFAVIGLALLAWIEVRGIDRLPIEDFARTPGASHVLLSPDGKRFAFLRDYRGQAELHIADVEDGHAARLDLGEATIADNARKEVFHYSWVGNERLIVTTGVWDTIIYGVLATNWEGGQAVPISGYEDDRVNVSQQKAYFHQVLHAFYDKDQTVLMLDDHNDYEGNYTYPDVLHVDTVRGTAELMIKNPGNVETWVADADGQVRLGILQSGGKSGAIYRDSDRSEWRTILPLQDRTGELRAVGFDAAGGRPLVAGLTPEKRWTIFPLDPATGAIGDPLVTDPEYDIVPNLPGGSIDGNELARPIFSRAKRALVGIRYETEVPRVKWFDRDYAVCQAALDRALPDTVNLFINASLDGKRTLWLAFSDRNPGVYFLLDAEKHKLEPIARRMPWIKPAQMASMLAVKYTARDGQRIHGYLTVPVGHTPPQGLPLVVLPHGGPWVRDTWGFDELVQLLANRGYAVLQMNYRGSPGYGDEFYEIARRQIGKAIQDDIEDGVHWAIGAGVADPKRVAILGMSYGGYSALFALGHNPDLYRCGVSFAGVSDWPAIFGVRDRSDSLAGESYRYWSREIGDPSKDLEFLRAISPVSFADKIVAPVLILQGKEDHIVPRDQAKRMIAALEKAGRKPQSLYVSELGHNWGNERQRLQLYTTLVSFLEKNLGPGAD